MSATPSQRDTKDIKVFYRSLRHALLMCKWVGMMPVSGLCNKDSCDIRFEWFSVSMAIYLFTLLGHLVKVFLYIFDNLQKPLSLRRTSNAIFVLSNVILSMLLLRFNINFRDLVKNIEKIEMSLPPLKNADRIIRNCYICMFGVMLFAGFEHILYTVYTYETMMDCFKLEDDSGLYMKSYSAALFAWVYRVLPFSYELAFFLNVLTVQGTFIWNFSDALIMGMSMYLLSRFYSFNRLLSEENIRKTLGSGLSWPEIRFHYSCLTKMVELVDLQVNPLVFVSFSSNLFFMCQQLFYLINYNFRRDLTGDGLCFVDSAGDWETTLYILYSLFFIFVRILLVSLLAAMVNSVSKESIFGVFSLPTRLYNPEVKRFLEQVSHSKVGLSGLNFFLVTKKMMLTVAATIVTYELVLLQIQKDK